MVDYSLSIGLGKSLKRGFVLAVIAGVIAAIGAFTQTVPVEVAWVIPVLTMITGFLEKLERNYREVKAENAVAETTTKKK